MPRVHLCIASLRQKAAFAEVLGATPWQPTDGVAEFTLWDGQCALPAQHGALITLATPLRARELFEALEQAQPRVHLSAFVKFDRAQRKLITNQNTIDLTEKETELLHYLFNHNECPREQLLKDIWGYSEEANTHTLETHIWRLRAKLEEALGAGEWVVATEQGYRLQIAEGR